MQEARKLADRGAKEITLLGQTVNSYKYDEGSGRIVTFAELLEAGARCRGLERIRFVTSYRAISRMTSSSPCATCQGVRVPAHPCPERLKPGAPAYEATVHGRAVRGTVGKARDIVRASRWPAISSSASAARRRRTTNRRWPWWSGRGTRTSTCSSTPSGRVRWPDRRLPDDIPRPSSSGGTPNGRPPERMCLEHHQALVGREVEVLVEGYSKAAHSKPRRPSNPVATRSPGSDPTS